MANPFIVSETYKRISEDGIYNDYRKFVYDKIENLHEETEEQAHSRLCGYLTYLGLKYLFTFKVEADSFNEKLSNILGKSLILDKELYSLGYDWRYGYPVKSMIDTIPNISINAKLSDKELYDCVRLSVLINCIIYEYMEKEQIIYHKDKVLGLTITNYKKKDKKKICDKILNIGYVISHKVGKRLHKHVRSEQFFYEARMASTRVNDETIPEYMNSSYHSSIIVE